LENFHPLLEVGEIEDDYMQSFQSLGDKASKKIKTLLFILEGNSISSHLEHDRKLKTKMKTAFELKTIFSNQSTLKKKRIGTISE